MNKLDEESDACIKMYNEAHEADATWMSRTVA